MRFLLESSSVPIYERINLALKRELEGFGHEVIFYRPDFSDPDAFLTTINQAAFDYYLVSNEGAYIHRYSDSHEHYLFELIRHPLIFLFHDNVFCGTPERSRLALRYQALQNVSHRSRIFCIERSNIEDLRQRGVDQVYFLPHATEFTPVSRSETTKQDVTFVGHTMASLQTFPLDAYPEARNLIGLAWLRYADLDTPVQHLLMKSIENRDCKDVFIERQYLLNLLNKMTFALRGEILGALNIPVVVHGGDLSYGQGDARLYRIPSPLIRYEPATPDYRMTARIYADASININITGLQFDTAINNRVFDVIAGGGTLLTDHKADLLDLFPYAKPISYRSGDDLREKLQAAQDPAILRELGEVCAVMREEILERFSYRNTASAILAAL